jgi:hypothetical protein
MIEKEIIKYENGNTKINSTETDVDRMKRELEEMQPKLVIAT